MRSIIWLQSCVLLLVPILPAAGAPFAPGNLVVTQIGDDDHQLNSTPNNAKPVYLVEISPSDPDGTVVQRIGMPTAVSGSNHRFTLNGDMRAGILTRSDNGLFLLLGGYDAEVETLAVNESFGTVVNRVVARVDAGGVVDTSTGLTDCYYGNPADHSNAKFASFRCVTSTDGIQLWLAGQDGTGDSSNARVRYATYGSTTSVTLNNSFPKDPRVVNVYNGRLYVCNNQSGSGAGQYRGVGTGNNFALPTTLLGEVFNKIPGYAAPAGTESISPYDFVMLDLNNDTQLETLYVADDRTTPSFGGLEKFTFDGTNWNYQYTLRAGLAGSPTQALRTVTGQAVGVDGHVALYAITASDTVGGKLVTVTDTGCPTGAEAGCSAADTFTVLQTAPAHTVFRGVRFAPRACEGAECVGACCMPGFTCTETVGANCNGLFRGIGTTCAATQCPLVCHTPFADADGDSDVDMDDFGQFQRCFTGSESTVLPDPQCKCFDRPEESAPDGDGDVDQADAVQFMNCVPAGGVGAGIPASCGG